MEFIDDSIVRAHQHSVGAPSKEDQVIGLSRCANTTKTYMKIESFELRIYFEITCGEMHDCKIAPEFIEKPPSSVYKIADKGCDSE